MIRHIVMFQFLPEAEGKSAMENAIAAKQRAELLPAQIPQIQSMQVVLNSKDADPSNFEFALICDFASIADLNTYQTHPAHVAFGKSIANLRQSRACIDYELEKENA